MKRSDPIERIRSTGEHDARRRALFFVLGDAPVTDDTIILMRHALSGVGFPEIDDVPTPRLRLWLMACSALRGLFAPNEVGEYWPETERIQAVAPSVAQSGVVDGWLVPMIDAKGNWQFVSPHPLGQVLADGLHQARSGLPVRDCEWCGNVFAPDRRDNRFCKPGCRSAHNSRVRRQSSKERAQS